MAELEKQLSRSLGRIAELEAENAKLRVENAELRAENAALRRRTRTDYPAAAPFNGEVSSWAYDAIGSATTAYAYQKIGTNPLNWQRLLTAGATSFTYDANGNSATMTGYTLGSDYENRLTTISGGATASYKYDYQGRRTTKTTGATTTYIYDGLNLIRESSAATRDYLFGPGIDEPLAISTAGTVTYYAADGLGSVSSLNDTAGTVQNLYAYDAWGVPRSSTEAVAQPFRYTARELGDLPSQWFTAPDTTSPMQAGSSLRTQ